MPFDLIGRAVDSRRFRRRRKTAFWFSFRAAGPASTGKSGCVAETAQSRNDGYTLQTTGTIVNYILQFSEVAHSSAFTEKFPSAKRRYLQSLLEGPAEESVEVLLEALKSGLPRRLYLDLIGPTMEALGRKWQDQEINVAQQNHANQIVLRHLELLRGLTPPKPALGKTAVVTAVAGDWHTIGARMVADFLYLEGFQVDFLGADTPTSDLISFVGERTPDLVALSVSLRESLPAFRDAVAGLRELPRRPRILAGGVAFRVAGQTAKAVVDGFGVGATEAVAEARRLLGLTENAPSLDEVLKELGRRIQSLRKSRGWNQSQLAEAAQMDRGYVSSVEHGRHNLTISVVLRIAEALEVPLELLLATEPPFQGADEPTLVSRL